MPRKLIRHLKKHRKYTIIQREKGFYDIYGDEFPMQLILTSQLDKNKNLWLKSLLNPLEDYDVAQNLFEQFEKHKKNRLYYSVLNMIVKVNEAFLQEGGVFMEKGYDWFMKEVAEKRYYEGIYIGITSLIADNLCEGKSKENICMKLQKYFDLTMEAAMTYIEEYMAAQDSN